MSNNLFAKSTATIAAWNLATFESLSEARIKKQVQGLDLLDAEYATLVKRYGTSNLGLLFTTITS